MDVCFVRVMGIAGLRLLSTELHGRAFYACIGDCRRLSSRRGSTSSEWGVRLLSAEVQFLSLEIGLLSKEVVHFLNANCY